MSRVTWTQQQADELEKKYIQQRMNTASAQQQPIKKPKQKRKIATQIIALCDELNKKGIAYTTEHQFHPERKWRFDIAIGPINGKRIAIEFHGGQWTKGGHLRGGNFANDLDKCNAAQMMGWIVLAFTTEHFGKDGIGAYGVVQLVKQVLDI